MNVPARITGLIPIVAAVAIAIQAPVFAASAPPAANAAPLLVPKISYTARTLTNGLTVYAVENHDSPTVAIQVWYKVGSKDDPEKRSGFAHLFEHLMFKSTRSMKSDMMDRLTEDVGGENNAYTSPDVTVYHETVPSNYLETLLWAEAERMANLNVNQPTFTSERAVVQEEFRQSVLAPPYGRLYWLINDRAYTRHPYQRDTIGRIGDLDAATLADVQQFHQTFYRPDNAVLVVAGDFDPAQMNRWVDYYFGRVSKPNTEIPRVATAEPTRTGERRYRETAPNVPLPVVIFNYLTPSARANDSAALRVLATILGDGESSRLYQALVYRQQIASDVSVSTDLKTDNGLLIAQATAASGKSLANLEAALQKEIEQIRQAPVSAAELARAKTKLLADLLRERETNAGKAGALADAAVLLGDPARVNTEGERLRRVTAADIRQAAATYLTVTNRVTLQYAGGPESAEIQAASRRGKTPPPSAEKSAATPTTPRPAETPPAPAGARSVRLPTPIARTLPNGLRVIVTPRPGSGLATARLLVRAGAAQDDPNKAGLADLTVSLLPQGTKSRTAPEIARQVAALGADLRADADYDGSTLRVGVPAASLAPALTLLSDLAQNPAFAAREVARLRAQTVDDLTVALGEPGTVARLVAMRRVYGNLPYGRPQTGTPASVQRLTSAAVRRFHQRFWTPMNAVLVIAGDVQAETVFAQAAARFGNWKGDAPKTALPASPPPRQSPRITIIDRPDAGQAAVLVMRPAIRRDDPQYITGEVANTVLGGGFSSRLNQEIRIKRGLSYGAGSRLDARRATGPFVAATQTKNATAAEAARLIVHEMQRLGKTAPDSAEMTTRRAALAGDFARTVETSGGLAAQIAEYALYQLPLARLNRFLPEVAKTNGEAVRGFAARHFAPSSAEIVIVGAARQFRRDLSARFPGANITVIPEKQLDTDQVNLRKRGQ